MRTTGPASEEEGEDVEALPSGGVGAATATLLRVRATWELQTSRYLSSSGQWRQYVASMRPEVMLPPIATIDSGRTLCCCAPAFRRGWWLL